MNHDIANLTDDCAEDALLAGAIVNPESFDLARSIVSELDFSDSGKGQMWSVFSAMQEAGLPFDIPMIMSQMRVHGVSDDLRSPARIASMINWGTPNAGKVDHHAKIVKRLSVKRQQIAVYEEAQSRLLDRKSSPEDVSQWMDAKMEAIGVCPDAGLVSIESAADAAIEEMSKPPTQRKVLMTGLINHDEMVGGWLPEELIIFGARPGCGKTAWAMQVCEHNAFLGRKCVYVSLEMSEVELVTRVLCGMAGVDPRVFRTGLQTQAHLDAIRKQRPVLEGMPLKLWAPSKVNVREIRAIAKQEAITNGIDLLVVDYLQLLEPTDSKVPRQEQVAAMSRGLKSIGRELKIPVLCLCQLNREADTEAPKLKHLRESGAIEQDADVVTFLHREDAKSQLIVAKHRGHGTTGKLDLEWNKTRRKYQAPDLGVDDNRKEEMQGWDNWNGSE